MVRARQVSLVGLFVSADDHVLLDRTIKMQAKVRNICLQPCVMTNGE